MSAEKKQNLLLGLSAMDNNHLEFFDILVALQSSSKADWMDNFKVMLEHTRVHFADEEALMKAHNYCALHEHLVEHKLLLDEMAFFFCKAQEGKKIFAKQYIDNYVYEKLYRHIINIDSQLAAFLKISTT